MCKTQTESCRKVFCKQMSIWDNEKQILLENSKAIYFQ